MPAVIGYDDAIQNAASYTTRTVVDSTASGSAVGSQPASNIFTKNSEQTFKRTGITSGTPAILDVNLTLRLDYKGIALVVLQNVKATNNSTQVPTNASVLYHNSAASFGGVTAYSYTSEHVALDAVARPVDHYFLIFGGDGQANYLQDRANGGNFLNTYNRFSITASGGAWDCEVGRLLVFRGLFLDSSPQWELSMLDETPVTRSYSGVPYSTSRRLPLRAISAHFQKISHAQLYGGAGAGGFTIGNPIRRLLAVAGSTQEIGLMPSATQASTGTAYRSFSESCAIGRIQFPCALPLIRPGATADRLHDWDFNLLESR